MLGRAISQTLSANLLWWPGRVEQPHLLQILSASTKPAAKIESQALDQRLPVLGPFLPPCSNSTMRRPISQ
jgi:hypothetical protein